ncbi:MAG: DPP IV N-terminal domain-containing protein [Candidatus Poribacteria bacterium]|nr:DPP IV N-terminal domain-containing protein [Candidatus Poribacteria bacterium]
MRCALSKRQLSLVRFGLFLIVACLLAASADLALAVEGKIVFTSERDGEKAVYVMDGDGGGASKVAEGAYPAWHPDGQSISFLYEGDLWLTDLNGSIRENLTNGRVSLGSCVPVSWSPDGRQIAYWGNSDQGWGVSAMDVNGRYKQIVSADWNRDGRVSWSPDGRNIAYSEMRKLDPPFNRFGSDIFVVNANGSNSVNLTANPAPFNISASWSPNGKKIAYVASPKPFLWLPPHNIHVMNADGSNPVMLTEAGRWVYEWNPTWSPDSRRIAFAKQTPDGFKDIFSMNADGSDLRYLTQTHRVEEEYPAWSPGAQAVSPSAKLVTQWGAVKHPGD